MSPYSGSSLYVFMKFLKLSVVNLTKLYPQEAGSIVKNSVKVLYHTGNINIVSYHLH